MNNLRYARLEAFVIFMTSPVLSSVNDTTASIPSSDFASDWSQSRITKIIS